MTAAEELREIKEKVDKILTLVENTNVDLSKDYVSGQEAAKWLQIGYNYFMTVWLKNKNVKSIRKGKYVYFLSEDIRRYV